MHANLHELHQELLFFERVRITRPLYYGVPILTMVFILISCATRPITIPAAPTCESALPTYSECVILPPLLIFERLEDEVILNPSKFGGPAIMSSLSAAARNVLTKAQCRLAETESLKAPEIVDLISRLQSLSSSLSVGQVTDEAKGILQRLAAQNQHLLILSHSLYVKVGPGSYWNPFSGAIGSSMSRSHLRASLVHCSSGQVLWKNEVLLRELPLVTSSKFAEALELLYANFPRKKEN